MRALVSSLSPESGGADKRDQDNFRVLSELELIKTGSLANVTISSCNKHHWSSKIKTLPAQRFCKLILSLPEKSLWSLESNETPFKSNLRREEAIAGKTTLFSAKRLFSINKTNSRTNPIAQRMTFQRV